MSGSDDKPSDGSITPQGHDQSTGVKAEGTLDQGDNEPLGRSGRQHWRESTITEAGLHQRGNVFFAAVEMTRMPMVLTDPNLPDNPVVFVNKAFLDLTGYEESEVLGRNCRFLQGPETDRRTVEELRAAIEAYEAVSVEILNYKRDGTAFWNGVFIGPVYRKDGELLYFFASQLDVTRRRLSEQSHRQNQKMEAIGQLTAGLAHDFNNLLQVVNGNLEMLVPRVEDERSRRYVDNARVAAERGAKLTRQLLSFARKTRLDPAPVNLSDLIQSFAEMLDSSLSSRAELHLSLRRRLPAAMIDADQFEMVLLNILMNSVDAMSKGGLITISTGTISLGAKAPARELPLGDYVFVEVADEGEGMPPHIIERAAEPFFTTKSVGKGTGLGLAMAQGFAAQSRGQMEIESVVGEGTRVRLLFPVSVDHACVPGASEPRRAAAAVDGKVFEHILVVEDNREVLELAHEILTSIGYRVTTAVAAEDALQLFDAAPLGSFDLLFTDVVMPGGMNGIVLAQEIARRDPQIGILLTTGYNEQMIAQGPKRAELDVLGKPYRQSELKDRVRHALDRRGQHQERRKPSDFGSVEA